MFTSASALRALHAHERQTRYESKRGHKSIIDLPTRYESTRVWECVQQSLTYFESDMRVLKAYNYTCFESESYDKSWRMFRTPSK
jgi:hypothetical protein